MMALGRTWIVVLDDSHARFFVRDSSGRLNEAAPALQSGVPTQSGVSVEARHRQREQFVFSVVATLDGACDGGCDRIMLVGPERMLSTMRKFASDKIRARLWREMAVEHAGSSEAELAQRLAPHFR